MRTIDRSSIDIMGIGRCLSEGALQVPLYQRSYAWEEKQVTDLFDDIGGAIEEDREDYFLGSVVTTRTNNSTEEVVDGQQRLATTTILLVAIRDYLLNNRDEERARWIEQRFLFEQDFDTLDILPKLKLNIEDHQYFLNNILKAPEKRAPQPATHSSHRRLTQAFSEARKYVKGIIETKGADRLASWIPFIEQKVKVIQIRVEDYSYAFSIFETLNDRGLDLTVSDLLKNYLYANSEDRITEVLAYWTSMTSQLDSVETDSLIVTFVRHAWAARNGLTRERELFTKIRQKVKTKQRALEFSKELADDSVYYSALLNSENEYWNEYSNGTAESVSSLNMLKMQQNRPLLLAILRNFSKKEIELSIRSLLNWAIRFIVTGTLGSSGLETNFSNNAAQIFNKSIKNTKELFETMKAIVPTDEEFEKAFSIFTVRRPDLARHLLQNLEIFKRGETQPELVPNKNSEQVNLEHILPKSPSSEWDTLPEDLHSALYKRLGNMCLIQGRINSKIGNKGFQEKLKVFKKSSFVLTKSLEDYTSWTQDDIEYRQMELAQLAVKVWPYTPPT